MRLKNLHLVLIALALTAVGCSNNQTTKQKPNVLIIVADDLGYADMSFLPYASKDIQTPNIDRIAKKGVFFDNAYSTAPICSPSRAGLITGRFQQRWGNYWYGEGGLPAAETTLPQMLKQQGYYNIKIGKTHLNGGPVEHPMDHGFDDFLGFIDHTWDYLRLSQKDVDAYGADNAKLAHIGPLYNGREKQSYENSFTTDIFTDKAVEVIQNKKGQPWYIELEYNAVHHPTYICHPEYLDKYGIDQFPFWNPEVEPYNEWHKKWGHMGEIDPDGRSRYQLQLEVMDNGIGKILNSLEKTGQINNTIIVFLSDNGGTINTYARNLPLNGYKYMFAEGGIRIPMIISYPKKLENKKTVSQLVSAMDIMPTVLSALNINVPENIDGNNLFPIIEDNTKGHERLCWADGRGQWVVRKGKWKLVNNTGWVHSNFKIEDGKAVSTEDFIYPEGILLFDLENDLGETKNLAEVHAGIVSELTSEYNAWRSEMSDPRTKDGKLKKKGKKMKK